MLKVTEPLRSDDMDVNTRLERYREHMLSRGWNADTTITDRLELLRRVTRELGDLRTLNADQLAGWLGRTNWSPATRANYAHHLNGYYLWEVKRGGLAANPMTVLDRPRVSKGKPRPTRLPHWHRIVAEADPKWRTCALLAGLAGLRACEITRLRRRDVDAELLVVHKGKGGYTNELPTHPMIWDAVQDLPPGLIIRNRHGRAYTPAALSSMFAAYCREKLGIDTSLHPLRHRYCTDLRRTSGGDLRVVQQAARHRSLQTTEIYTEVEGTEIRAAIQNLRPAA